jgi:Mrp family chromosome partitioning ATPase
MSSLDQAFIRAYTKDRRTQNSPSPGSNSAAGTPDTSGATRSVGSGDIHSNSGSGTLHTSQSGKWFRVDPATSSSTTRHSRLGNETTPESQSTRRDPNTSLPLSNDKFSVVHPAQIPNSNLKANTHPLTPANSIDSPRGSVTAEADSNHAQAFFQLNSASTSQALSADNVNRGDQRPIVKTTSGRQTLADYINQSQAAIVPATQPAEEAVAIDQTQWTTTIADTNSSQVARSGNSSFAAWRYDTLAPESSHNLESHLNQKAAAPAVNKLQGEQSPATKGTTDSNSSSAAKEISNHAGLSQRGITDTQKIKESIQDFNSVWEVDELFWPEVSDELFKQQERSFNKVAAYLSDACRGGLSVLAVTSAVRGEGRTTVASCIARCAAKRGLKVVLVDGDLEHPSLADSLNLEIARGWSDALQENIPLEEVAVHSIEDQLTLIPLVTTEPSQDFSSTDSRIQSMLKRLTESFDLVVLDVPQVNSVGSRMIGAGTSPGIDAALLVTDCRIEDSQRIETALRRLKNLGIQSVGVVENFARS